MPDWLAELAKLAELADQSTHGKSQGLRKRINLTLHTACTADDDDDDERRIKYVRRPIK